MKILRTSKEATAHVTMCKVCGQENSHPNVLLIVSVGHSTENERYHRFQWQQPLQLVTDLLSHHYIRAFYCAGPPSFLIPASKEASGPKNLGIHLGQQLRLSFNPRIVSTCTTLSNSNHCILFSINHVRRTIVEQLKLIPTMHLTQANTSACSQYLLSH